MKVSLINFTDNALELLLRTKNTRLSNEADPVEGWSEEKKAEHLKYMLTTIKSSWEMVDYVFSIEGVTRAFTHELVRHRHGSYAQQSQRVVDVRESEVIRPASIDMNDAELIWDAAVKAMKEGYGALMDIGIPTGDARGLIPTNITTSIIAKFSLRSLHEMAKVRLCTRATGEFQDVMRAMKEVVVFHHPWAEDFINVQCVADGTCAFPRYGENECPVWFPELDREFSKDYAKEKWSRVRYSANPKAKGGLT